MKKKLVILTFVILCILLYLCAVFLPYKKQEAVSAGTEEKFQLSDFYGEQEGQERAAVLYTNEEALAERIRLISGAREKITLSTFDFKADNSGKKVLAALSDAAKRGVEVEVLVDGFSYFSSISGRPHFKALGSLEHATIKVYNPVNFFRPSRLMARLHDKYLIVDNTAYIIGGRNTYDFFLGDETDYKNYDWDILICPGNSSQESSMKALKDYADIMWGLDECRTVMDRPSDQTKKKVRKADEELTLLYQQMQEEHRDWFLPAEYEKMTVPTNRVSLIANPIHASVKEPVLFYQLTELMLQAEGDVVFHTPYILCSNYMTDRLKTICESGKKVQMMTNSVANNGNPFGSVDYQDRKPQILKTGVEIMEYDQGTSYHGKCFRIGDRLSGAGSFNWDMRSAYIDTELMLVIDSPQFNQIMEDYMEAYENDALLVKDESSYHLQDGQIPQELSFSKKLKITLLKPVDKVLRFLF